MTTNQLRPVAPGEKPVRKGLASVLKASATGDRGDVLRAMQERLARAMDDPTTPSRDLPPLARRLLEVGELIEAREAADRPGSVVSATADESWDGGA